jgi:hypothetical protein
MIWLRRLVVVIERILVGLFAIEIAMMLLDLSQAWNAQPCSVNVTPTCYPWGTEGPTAGSWNYLNKRNYLTSEIFTLTVLTLGLSLALALRRNIRIVALIAAILLLAVSDYFIPSFL